MKSHRILKIITFIILFSILTVSNAFLISAQEGESYSSSDNSSQICALECAPQNIPLNARIAANNINMNESISAFSSVTINVTSPCDEEWRNRYPDSWMWEVNRAVEGADDYLYSQFGINYVCVAQNYWTSPNNLNYSELLNSVIGSHGLGTQGELMIAFSGEKLGVGGVGRTNNPYCLVFDQGREFNIHVTQHETGHCYGLNHCAEGTHCLMALGAGNYAYTNQLCSPHYSDWSSHRSWHNTR